jgi:hypothetical protein
LHFGRKLVIRWRNSREAYRSSEAAAFRDLRNASRASNAPAAYRSLLTWLSRFRPGVGLTPFLSNTGDSELTREVASLGAKLYGHDAGKWSGKKMIDALERIRSSGQREKTAYSVLPPLNPVAGRLGLE